MKATELQIGDLVWLSDDICIKVEQITKRKIGYHAKANESKMHYARLCDIEPIPITPEILEKNGFEVYTIRNTAFCTIESVNFVICDNYIWCGIEVLGCKHSHYGIKFIHELQHALRLCKIDKEIKV